jgi:hypothetical protein
MGEIAVDWTIYVKNQIQGQSSDKFAQVTRFLFKVLVLYNSNEDFKFRKDCF